MTLPLEVPGTLNEAKQLAKDTVGNNTQFQVMLGIDIAGVEKNQVNIVDMYHNVIVTVGDLIKSSVAVSYYRMVNERPYTLAKAIEEYLGSSEYYEVINS